jgi:hypothetical protein
MYYPIIRCCVQREGGDLQREFYIFALSKETLKVIINQTIFYEN